MVFGGYIGVIGNYLRKGQDCRACLKDRLQNCLKDRLQHCLKDRLQSLCVTKSEQRAMPVLQWSGI
jgi:hypothetical protein